MTRFLLYDENEEGCQDEQTVFLDFESLSSVLLRL